MWFKKKKGDAEAALEAPAEGQSDDPNALPEVPVAAPQQAQQQAALRPGRTRWARAALAGCPRGASPWP